MRKHGAASRAAASAFKRSPVALTLSQRWLSVVIFLV
jgi:hypothetical protein